MLKTLIGLEALETQPVAVLVNTKVALPACTPVTTPALLMVAIEGSLLAQVPPETGDKVVVLPAHTTAEPEMAVDGIGFTTIWKVEKLTQAPVFLVYVIVTLPGAFPMTRPELLMLAIAAFDVVHIPPGLEADKTVDSPTQILLSPLTTDPSC